MLCGFGRNLINALCQMIQSSTFKLQMQKLGKMMGPIKNLISLFLKVSDAQLWVLLLLSPFLPSYLPKYMGFELFERFSLHYTNFFPQIVSSYHSAWHRVLEVLKAVVERNHKLII